MYFRLTGRAPFEHLIYPPPIPGALGTHYRRDLGGQAVFGPDLAYVETEDYTVDPARAAGFYDYVRQFWPGLPDGALSPDYAGIRPKLHGPDEPQPDFRLDGPTVARPRGPGGPVRHREPRPHLVAGHRRGGRDAPGSRLDGDRPTPYKRGSRGARLGSSDG